MPDNKDSLLGFVRNQTPNTGMLTQTERDLGMTQGLKDLMGGSPTGVLPPITPDAHYVYTMTDPTTGDKLPYFRVVKEGHPAFGSDIGPKALVQEGLTPNIPDISTKLRSMQAAGASSDEMENAIQEIQNVHSAIAQEARLGWGTVIRNGMSRILGSGFNGAVMPISLQDLIETGDNARYRQMGGS